MFLKSSEKRKKRDLRKFSQYVEVRWNQPVKNSSISAAIINKDDFYRVFFVNEYLNTSWNDEIIHNKVTDDKNIDLKKSIGVRGRFSKGKILKIEKENPIFLNLLSKKLQYILLAETGTNLISAYKFSKNSKYKKTCEFSTRPLENKSNKNDVLLLDNYQNLINVLNKMMGQQVGRCEGSWKVHDGAAFDLMDSIFLASNDPWKIDSINKITKSWRGDSIVRVNKILEVWGYSGVWNHKVYKQYLKYLKPAENDLFEYYKNNFKLKPKLAK